MKQVELGQGTGLKVSEYCLGTGNFGTRWGAGATPETSRQMFDRFVEAGGTFFDCADIYQFGESEELLGQFVRPQRSHYVLATKFTLGATASPALAETGNSRKTMIDALEQSLLRLGTDYIDVFFVHTPDGLTSSDEIARTVDDLVRSGKILYGAVSNFPAWRVARLATVAELRGWSRLATVQIEYSLADRGADRDLVPMAEAYGLALMLWSPLGGGLLTGKYRKSDAGRLTDWQDVVHREDSAQKTAVIDRLFQVADERGVTPAQVAMAWLRRRSSGISTSVIPIIGPRDLAQLADYLGALEVELTDEEFDSLDSLSAVRPGIPHESAAGAQAGALGGDASRVARPPVPVR
jgi:aryl-alcohol dehydrogenase-like predicted oxidoreductase